MSDFIRTITVANGLVQSVVRDQVATADIAAGAVTDTQVAAANKDGTAGTASMRTLGTGSTQAAAGNDSRLSDSRTPTGTAGGALTGTYPNPTLAKTYREQLTGARTYYVRTDGSNSNDGLANTAGGAFLTIQKAVDVASALDNGGFDVTIQVGDGTYTGAVSFKSFVGSGLLVIQGNSGTPANVLVSTTAANAFAATNVLGQYKILDLEIRTTTSGNCLQVTAAAVQFGNLIFGACAGNHISSLLQGSVEAVSNYTVTGGAAVHWGARSGQIQVAGRTVTITGTPAFSVAWGYADVLGVLTAYGNTYSGSATGPRYAVSTNAIIQTFGSGTLVFPGNVAGSTATGGIYA